MHMCLEGLGKANQGEQTWHREHTHPECLQVSALMFTHGPTHLVIFAVVAGWQLHPHMERAHLSPPAPASSHQGPGWRHVHQALCLLPITTLVTVSRVIRGPESSVLCGHRGRTSDGRLGAEVRAQEMSGCVMDIAAVSTANGLCLCQAHTEIAAGSSQRMH